MQLRLLIYASPTLEVLALNMAEAPWDAVFQHEPLGGRLLTFIIRCLVLEPQRGDAWTPGQSSANDSVEAMLPVCAVVGIPIVVDCYDIFIFVIIIIIIITIKIALQSYPVVVAFIFVLVIVPVSERWFLKSLSVGRTCSRGRRVFELLWVKLKRPPLVEIPFCRVAE